MKYNLAVIKDGQGKHKLVIFAILFRPFGFIAQKT